MATQILLIAALVPAAGLGFYVYKRDRVEKEPFGLLMLCLLGGLLSIVITLLISAVTSPLIDVCFQNSIVTNDDGTVECVGSMFSWYAYNFVLYFFGVGLVEEFSKWIMMFLFTRKNKNFNSSFDGIVYAVFVSLGFAALENVLYVFQYGMGTAIARAIMSVPAHVFFGIFMGFYYSRWKILVSARDVEKRFADNGCLTLKDPLFNGKKMLVLSVVIPTAVHGFYDFCLSVGNLVFTLVCFAFLGFLYFYCFRTVRRMARADDGIFSYAKALVFGKYGLNDEYIEAMSCCAEEPVVSDEAPVEPVVTE